MWKVASTCIGSGRLCTVVLAAVVAVSVTGTAEARRDTTPTSAPSVVVTAATSTSISISWQKPTDRRVKLAGYRVYLNGSVIAVIQTTSYTFARLACGRSYNVDVQSYDRAGNTSAFVGIVASTGACPDTTAPTAPTNVTQTGSTQNSVSLSWTASADNVGVTRYDQYRDGAGVGTAQTTSYTFSGLSCGRSYTLGMEAVDAAGNVSPHVSVFAGTSPCPDTLAPTAPTFVVQTAASTSTITLSWAASLDNVGVAGYGVYVNGVRISTTTWTAFSVGSLACGTTYNLGVDAFDAAGNRSATTSVLATAGACATAAPTDTQAPSAPSVLVRTAATATSVSLGWNASTDNVGVAGYSVYVNGGSAGSTTSTTSSFAGLACGTSYTLGVDAYDASGNRSSRSQLVASTIACTAPVGSAFYVSPAGSDAGLGTQGSPWRTIAKAMATLSGGQTAYLRAGTYEEAKGGACDSAYNTVTWSKSGTATAPITISGYPGEEKQVIVKTKLRLTGNFLRLRNLVTDRNYALATPEFTCIGEPGVVVYGDDHEVSGLEIRNSNMSGIYLESDRTKITRNYIHDNGSHYNQDHGVYWASGVGGLIANNVIEQNQAFGIHMYPSPVGQRIVQNTITGSGRAGIILAGARDQIVVNNISAWNQEEGIRTSAGGCVGCWADKNLLHGNSSDYYLPEPLSILATIHADPLFINLGLGDYHLLIGSPSVDVARADYTETTDYDNRPRPQGGAPDVGAFER